MKSPTYTGIVVIMSLVVIAVVFLTRSNPKTVDAQTSKLCFEYAIRDHEKEVAPERWQKLHKDWTSFDWYQSCVNHHKFPVAK